MMEFHISRKARDHYQFAESLFSYTGNVVFANMAACREFAYRMNLVRDVASHPSLAVHAGQLYAMGLIDEASHVLKVTFPRPHVDTAQVAIDPGKVQTLDLRGGWMLFDKDETRDHAMAELRPQVIAEASASHFRELAEIRGLETTTKLLKPLAEALTRDNISVQVTYRD